MSDERCDFTVSYGEGEIPDGLFIRVGEGDIIEF